MSDDDKKLEALQAATEKLKEIRHRERALDTTAGMSGEAKRQAVLKNATEELQEIRHRERALDNTTGMSGGTRKQAVIKTVTEEVQEIHDKESALADTQVHKMDFISEGNSIYCVRKSQGRSPSQSGVKVASFDGFLTKAPPHVQAKLLPEETIELEKWLEERNELKEKLESNSLGETLLETIPGLINKATLETKKMSSIDSDLYLSLKTSLTDFLQVIKTIEQTKTDSYLHHNALQKTEITKEQIKEISDHL